jgi:hypothetical protein
VETGRIHVHRGNSRRVGTSVDAKVRQHAVVSATPVYGSRSYASEILTRSREKIRASHYVRLSEAVMLAASAYDIHTSTGEILYW